MSYQAASGGQVHRSTSLPRPSVHCGPIPKADRILLSKAIADRACALVLLVFITPFLMIVALAVKLTSRGPVIYSQVRVGLRGRSFVIYKIRTMVVDSERDTGPTWASTSDSRITPIGRFLRRSHLDELPQVWNVLRGDMSLVGPRPERPEIIARLEEEIPRYRERLAVRPGVTGLAQIQLPPDSDIDDVRRKLAYDLFYIRRPSLRLDLRIILGTAFMLLGIPFTLSGRLLQIPDGPTIRETAPDLLTDFELAGLSSGS